jgi:hypothetical protein
VHACSQSVFTLGFHRQQFTALSIDTSSIVDTWNLGTTKLSDFSIGIKWLVRGSPAQESAFNYQSTLWKASFTRPHQLRVLLFGQPGVFRSGLFLALAALLQQDREQRVERDLRLAMHWHYVSHSNPKPRSYRHNHIQINDALRSFGHL